MHEVTGALREREVGGVGLLALLMGHKVSIDGYIQRIEEPTQRQD